MSTRFGRFQAEIQNCESCLWMPNIKQNVFTPYWLRKLYAKFIDHLAIDRQPN
jgi:hypothetical protein